MNDEAPLGRRERKKREMRANILDAATRLFCEHGYRVTTISEVADDLDISSATFFNYFGSKDAVLEALADEVIVGLEIIVGEIAEAPERGAEIFASHLRVAPGTTPHYRVLSRELAIEVLRVLLARPQSASLLRRLEQAIAQIITVRPGLRGPDHQAMVTKTARRFVELGFGALAAWMASDEPLEPRITEIVEFGRTLLDRAE